MGETKRIASAGQRIVLHAKDRGCTRPGCTAPGYLSEVHHVNEWAKTHRTDIDDLTFACGPDSNCSTTKAGPPAKTNTASPNGSRQPTWTSANHEPTATGTPNATSDLVDGKGEEADPP